MISILIVNYHVKEELFACVASIYASKPKSSFEIIIIDNDEKKIIEKELKKQFPKVRYIKNNNKGFGQGNNTGAKYAKGEYIFILNPDTKLLNNCIDELSNFLNKQKHAGIVAPVLFDNNNHPYPLQGTKELTPLRAIFSLSFINKLFPKNKIHQDYYMSDWNKKNVKEVDCVPGTAFIIRKDIFKKLRGFDENFFLFFDEIDLCKRVKNLGWKIFMTPKAQIFHAWGSSTKKSKRDISKIFRQSRFYYLKKHFGFLKALGTETILRVDKYIAIIFLLMILGLYLRLFNIENAMSFIGDQGWYYLSARDMVLKGDIPLVGIASSHPWLHQGALWTYMLAPVLWLSNFHPISGAYLTIFIGMISFFGIYKLGSVMFSKTVGVIAAALFATSPLVIFSDRMPYHTSPLPLFVIIALYCLYKWVQGNYYYFSLLIITLAVLYNFEFAALLFSLIVLVVWLYGFAAKKDWAKGIFTTKIVFLAVGGWLAVMLPMLLYDFTHGFPQTFKVVAWVGYRVLVFLGYTPINPITPVTLSEMVSFIGKSYTDMIFSYSGAATFFIVIASIVFLIVQVTKQSNKKAFVLLGVVNLFLLIGLFIAKTPSGAYLPIIFPGVILLIALLFDWLVTNKRKILQVLGVLMLISVLFLNSIHIFQKTSADFFFSQRLEAARSIVKEAGEKEYNLKGQGYWSKFESFTMNYEYLAWWLGNGPTKEKQALQFVVSEGDEVKVEKRIIGQ